MRAARGRQTFDDDEWYTPRPTADALAAWLAWHLDPDTPILCPADLLPDGQESAIPQALRAVGFRHVRVTRDLPVSTQPAQDWLPGEVVVTNPPFTLLVPFRKWAESSGSRFCMLSRPASLQSSWPIPELGDKFYSIDGRGVAAAWMQNLVDTSVPDPTLAIGNCRNCERRRCPANSMTGGLTPRQDRPLYGFRNAVLVGVAGWWCNEYIFNGKRSFARFFNHSEEATQ